MPSNPERRAQILDAAIGILADVGVGGLTHRQVDDRADLPAGTTSNYFRTRQALLEATAARTVDLHWQRVEALRAAIGSLTRFTPEGVKALLTTMISDPDEQTRRYTLARFELFMEGTRRPELRPFLTELQTAAVKSATLIFEAAGFTPKPQQMEELSRLLNGYLFSNLTISGATDDPAGLVERLLRAFFEA
ncbi:MAG TPA: TetR family transcriptional regulator [Mycobacterium sp.]|jgi:DNA-binding transcriptional regulator YbjK|nr:TetR family transcriptional regulator [Mycobacterium sp.]